MRLSIFSRAAEAVDDINLMLGLKSNRSRGSTKLLISQLHLSG